MKHILDIFAARKPNHIIYGYITSIYTTGSIRNVPVWYEPDELRFAKGSRRQVARIPLGNDLQSHQGSIDRHGHNLHHPVLIGNNGNGG